MNLEKYPQQRSGLFFSRWKETDVFYILEDYTDLMDGRYIDIYTGMNINEGLRNRITENKLLPNVRANTLYNWQRDFTNISTTDPFLRDKKISLFHDDYIISAKPGYGKTWAFIYAVLSKLSIDKDLAIKRYKENNRNEINILPNTASRFIYASPLRALVDEKVDELVRLFAYIYGYTTQAIKKANIITSVKGSNPVLKPKSTIIWVCTYEHIPTIIKKLSMKQNLASKDKGLSKIAELQLVCIDEIHNLMGANRGSTIDSVISMIRMLRKGVSVTGDMSFSNVKNIGLMMLSGTISDKIKNIIIDRMEIKYLDYISKCTDKSSVNLTSHVAPGDEEYKPRTEKSDNNFQVNLSWRDHQKVSDDTTHEYRLTRKGSFLEFVESMLVEKKTLNKLDGSTGIIFISYKKTILSLAEDIITSIKRDYIHAWKVKRSFEPSKSKIIEKNGAGIYNIINNLLDYGICIHYAGLEESYLEQVLLTFKDNMSNTRLILCTSTLATGVNISTDNVYIYDRPVSSEEPSLIIQMIGRTGRTKSGSYYITFPLPTIEDMVVSLSQNNPRQYMYNMFKTIGSFFINKSKFIDIIEKSYSYSIPSTRVSINIQLKELFETKRYLTENIVGSIAKLSYTSLGETVSSITDNWDQYDIIFSACKNLSILIDNTSSANASNISREKNYQNIVYAISHFIRDDRKRIVCGRTSAEARSKVDTLKNQYTSKIIELLTINDHLSQVVEQKDSKSNEETTISNNESVIRCLKKDNEYSVYVPDEEMYEVFGLVGNSSNLRNSQLLLVSGSGSEEDKERAMEIISRRRNLITKVYKKIYSENIDALSNADNGITSNPPHTDQLAYGNILNIYKQSIIEAPKYDTGGKLIIGDTGKGKNLQYSLRKYYQNSLNKVFIDSSEAVEYLLMTMQNASCGRQQFANIVSVVNKMNDYIPDISYTWQHLFPWQIYLVKLFSGGNDNTIHYEENDMYKFITGRDDIFVKDRYIFNYERFVPETVVHNFLYDMFMDVNIYLNSFHRYEYGGKYDRAHFNNSCKEGSVQRNGIIYPVQYDYMDLKRSEHFSTSIPIVQDGKPIYGSRFKIVPMYIQVMMGNFIGICTNESTVLFDIDKEYSCVSFVKYIKTLSQSLNSLIVNKNFDEIYDPSEHYVGISKKDFLQNMEKRGFPVDLLKNIDKVPSDNDKLSKYKSFRDFCDARSDLEKISGNYNEVKAKYETSLSSTNEVLKKIIYNTYSKIHEQYSILKESVDFYKELLIKDLNNDQSDDALKKQIEEYTSSIIDFSNQKNMLFKRFSSLFSSIAYVSDVYQNFSKGGYSTPGYYYYDKVLQYTPSIIGGKKKSELRRLLKKKNTGSVNKRYFNKLKVFVQEISYDPFVFMQDVVYSSNSSFKILKCTFSDSTIRNYMSSFRSCSSTSIVRSNIKAIDRDGKTVYMFRTIPAEIDNFIKMNILLNENIDTEIVEDDENVY